MQLTPYGSYKHIKESIVQYLETQYRISHQKIFEERGEILRRHGVVAQQPFIESTPSFPTAHKLSVLEDMYPQFIPQGISELVQHGLPIDKYDLYTLQEEAIIAAFGDKPCLLVATGTGSGKTEAFVLPILADILQEAKNWPAPEERQERGRYEPESNVWLHSRRNETRPAALRSIILYPMNALVNDQLSRLRRILSLNDSPEWQRRNLNGNVIHFGMYTSLCKPTGGWTDKWRRDMFSSHFEKIEKDWQYLRKDLRETGFWPRPDSTEMVCRWDMQMAPPDIMVTNYSMLEYMLVRPIENEIFETTKNWLHDNDDAQFTLVLDEAHTYTGARGTEVAHLVRRLKERLGLDSGSKKFRSIATTASLPNNPNAKEELFDFMEDLFGEPRRRFTLITLPDSINELPNRKPTEKSLKAFADFYGNFTMTNPNMAIEQISKDLNLGHVDKTIEPEIALYRLLENSEDIIWVRQRTARNSTLLSDLANECWGDLGDDELREWATSGIISAGSFARPQPTTDIPPLLSVRMHLFFRGISGLWACMNPNCSEVSERYFSGEYPRPVGKLFTEPREWCDCGARVLELFSCRNCGLLFLGGIPDTTLRALWPWSDDLSGERQDINEFRIFGVESPNPDAKSETRSYQNTMPCHPNDSHARNVWEVEPNKQDKRVISPFPAKCPRCQKYSGVFYGNREIIEPLRTKGPQSFSLIVEDGFRVQPRAAHSEPPNYGRKALLFSDSRQEAAKLAGDLRFDHQRDLFRQLLYQALYTCSVCYGSGEIEEIDKPYKIGQEKVSKRKKCPMCKGTGYTENPDPIDYQQLKNRVVNLQLSNGINPTTDLFEGYFKELDSGSDTAYAKANVHFNVSLRRELSEEDFGLEPLGLANWEVKLPAETGEFPKLNEEETKTFLQLVSKIITSENVLLWPDPNAPWDWPKDIVRDYEKCKMIPAKSRTDNVIPYNLSNYRKLGRYIIEISKTLVSLGRLKNNSEAESWVYDLHWPLWNALCNFNILTWAGAKVRNQVPKGISIDSFVLHPIKDFVYQCKSCRYITAKSLFNVCVRCGQKTEPINPSDIRNYYRREAQFIKPDSPFEDPYPLRAIEHTAQIPGAEARDLERWFQDLFHDNQHPLDHRIDVLSVTTTMEMGIDIGSLLCVGLRNVPPNVANYQQRAGRAGRRGSALATVLSFAQQRSHDQYYFSKPPEIVTSPPRVPALYIQNEVIARRHVRSLVLQDFFYKQQKGLSNRGLFGSWGKISDFCNLQHADKIRSYISVNKATTSNRCKKIISKNFHDKLDKWLIELPGEVQKIVQKEESKKDLFECLINEGLLPKYAFPVDVVSLVIPDVGRKEDNRNQSDKYFWYETENDSMQRDLKIALAEYAPGSEVIRGEFPKTYIFKSSGLYDAYDKDPDYRPGEVLVECQDCQSIEIIKTEDKSIDECGECGSFNVLNLPFVRPPGFTVDWAEPRAGAKDYTGGGRETSGYVAPARLLVGKTSFNGGKMQEPFAPNLYSYVRVGDLFLCNKGPNPRNFPGFLICPKCGRALNEDDPGSHTYPNNIPPFRGRNRGPKKGDPCPNRTDFQNQVLLGYRFHSEVILLGVDLPNDMDASFYKPSGRAVWYSFGTLVSNAAALVLQVDPSELRVGIRAVRRAPKRIHGEVFLYDDVPGGAGYARAIEENLEEILNKALEIGKNCPNPDCQGACYHCLFDYRNQGLHPLLDRFLGTAVLDYILNGNKPTVSTGKADSCATMLNSYVKLGWKTKPSKTLNGVYLSSILEDKSGNQIGLWVTHPLEALPGHNNTQSILAQYNIRCAVHNTFDLERRPFWVMNHLV
jgi:ATP-dependent helicase YprA (DUF1998 family)